MEKNKNLISISGKSGSGKDTVAVFIQGLIIEAKDPSFFIIPKSNIIDPLTNRFPMTTGMLDYLRYASTVETLEAVSQYSIHRFADNLKQIVSLLTGIPRLDLEKEEVKNSYLGDEWNTLMVANYFIGSSEEFRQLLEENKNIKPVIQNPINMGDNYRFDYYEMVHRMTVRELLQKCGTDALRNNVHKDVHVNALFANYKGKVSGRTAIIDFSEVSKDIIYVSESIYGEFPKWIIPDLRFYNEFLACKQRGAITIRVERDYDKSDPKYLHLSETGLDDMRDEFDYTITNNSTIQELIESVKYILKKEQII